MLLAVSPTSAWAANHYVRSAATGTGTGADWTNACTDFTGSCAAGSLIRGDTYYVAAGTYVGTVFLVPESGTSTISILSARIDGHGTSTGWSDSFVGAAVFTSAAPGGVIWAIRTGYWIFDGIECSPTLTCGFRLDKSPEATLGCAQGGTALTIGETLTRPSTIQVKHVEIKGTSNTTTPDSAGVFDLGARLFWTTNVTLSSLWVHDQGAGWIALDSTTNTTIESSIFRNNRSTSTCHAEGVALRSIYGAPVDGNTNITLRWNLFENSDGTGYVATPSNGSGTSSNWYIYGNRFVFNAGDSNGQASGNGAIQLFGITQTGDFFFYNNTIAALDRGPSNSGSCGIVMAGGQSIAALTVRNNLWYNCQSPILVSTPGVTTLVWTHNAYFTTTTNDTNVDKQVASGNPFVDVSQVAGHTDFHLANATTAGVTLASPYNTDPDNVTRGVDGTWDRGAYESATGAPSVPSPVIPPGGKVLPRRRR